MWKGKMEDRQTLSGFGLQKLHGLAELTETRLMFKHL